MYAATPHVPVLLRQVDARSLRRSHLRLHPIRQLVPEFLSDRPGEKIPALFLLQVWVQFENFVHYFVNRQSIVRSVPSADQVNQELLLKVGEKCRRGAPGGVVD